MSELISGKHELLGSEDAFFVKLAILEDLSTDLCEETFTGTNCVAIPR